MESQDVEYDSVADLRVAVSHNEEDKYFVADDATVDGSSTQSWSRGHVSAVDPRVKNVTAVGTSSSEPMGLLSAISRWLLPSYLQSGRPRSAPVTMGTDGRPTVQPTEGRASRAATSATSGHPDPGASRDPRGATAYSVSHRRRPAVHAVPATLTPAYTVFTDHPYLGQLLPARRLRRSYHQWSAHTESCRMTPYGRQ